MEAPSWIGGRHNSMEMTLRFLMCLAIVSVILLKLSKLVRVGLTVTSRNRRGLAM